MSKQSRMIASATAYGQRRRHLTATLAAKGTTSRYDADHISAFGFNAAGSVFDPADPNPYL